VVIYDNSLVTDSDLQDIFFFTRQDLGKKVTSTQKSVAAAEKIAELNSFAKVRSVEVLDQHIWRDVKCVCVDRWTVSEAVDLDRISQDRGISLYLILSSHMRAFCISLKRPFTEDTLESLLSRIPVSLIVPRRRANLLFKCFLGNLYSEYIHSIFFNNSTPDNSEDEMSFKSDLISSLATYFCPTSSILGGLICNDMIQFLTTGATNFKSYLLFDGHSSEATVDYI
jgi:hypothetical protein